MKLRDYQERAVEAAWASQARATLVVAPTGAGKGTMATEMLYRASRNKCSALFVVHRREIITDISKRLARRGVRIASTRMSDQHIRVLSVQAALRMTPMSGVDLLILDEAHHYAAKDWGRIMDHTRPRKVVGFTATPQRADGKPLGGMFKHLIDAVSYSELLERGHIVGARTLRPRELLAGTQIAQDPVDAYLRYGRNERALIFVRRIEEADAVAKSLQSKGVAAGVNHSRMKHEVRDQTMRDLESGELRVVVNVGTLTEGVDLPHVTCIVLARPCSHQSIYVQIVGRVLRAAPNKREGTLIDLVGASHRHGLPAADRVYSLSGQGIRLEAPADEPAPRERSGEPKDTSVLDVDLEEVSSDCSNQPQYAPIEKRKPGGQYRSGVLENETASERRRRLARERYQKEQEALGVRVKPAPAVISPGFIFQDKGFWTLRWREHGAKQRMGLSTTDKEVAEECLRIFRAEGPLAVQKHVQARKRKALSVYFDTPRDMFTLVRRDGDRTRRARKALYTNDRTEAQKLLELFQEGRIRVAEKQIEAIRSARGNHLLSLAQRQQRADAKRQSLTANQASAM